MWSWSFLSVHPSQPRLNSALIRDGKPENATTHQGNSAVILLDTHVISELMRPHPEPRVLARADGLDPKAVAITAMT